MTDSDIEDPKYLPGGNYPPNENQLIENNLNTDNFIDPSQNQMFLQSQVMNLENENMISNQNLEQIENENNQLKAELMEYKKKFDKKEGINKEFKLMPVAFKQRFNEYEKRNALLQKNINDLEMQLKNKDIELAESLKEKNKSETAIRNANIYKQYMDELQNEFKDKVNKLNKKSSVKISKPPVLSPTISTDPINATVIKGKDITFTVDTHSDGSENFPPQPYKYKFEYNV